MSHITLNKNAVHGDVSAMSPGGVRIGAPAVNSNPNPNTNPSPSPNPNRAACAPARPLITPLTH